MEHIFQIDKLWIVMNGSGRIWDMANKLKILGFDDVQEQQPNRIIAFAYRPACYSLYGGFEYVLWTPWLPYYVSTVYVLMLINDIKYILR